MIEFILFTNLFLTCLYYICIYVHNHILLAIFLKFRPYWIVSTPSYDAQQRIDNVLKSLLKQEQNVYVNPDIRVAVGYGACLDIFVDAKDIFGKYKPPQIPSHSSQIRTMEELLETFAYFFSQGAAAELVIRRPFFHILIAHVTVV